MLGLDLGMRQLFTLLVLTAISLFSAADTADKPVLLASIKPIQLIALAIAGEYADVQLLLPASVSPHLYQLKPSDRERLASADRIIWVGPSMERFLQKPLSLLDGKRVIRLSSQEADDMYQEKGHGTEHQHGARDPHLWLDPQQALLMAEQIYRALVVIAPQYQMQYRQQWQQFKSQLNALDKEITIQFQEVSAKPYMVLHDGYSHFESHYGVRRVAALSVTPDKKPGAKHLWQLRQQLTSGEVACVFREPQYQPAMLDALLAGTSVKIALIDPLASDVSATPQGYLAFFQQFSAAFIDCIR